MKHVLFLALFVLACSDDSANSGHAVREDSGSDTGENENDPIGTVTLRDGGLIDAGVIVASCEGEDDGTSCGSMGGLVCIDDDCVSSLCGDGFADLANESCDDGDLSSGDGCEEDCTFTCVDDAECNDGNACDGAEQCDADAHVCVGGSVPDDGEQCSTPAVEDGECRDELCVPKGCGDSEVVGDEECDDGNSVSGDGCEPTCAFTCEIDEECFDGNVCTGVESCDLAMHVCRAGTPLECDPENECTVGTCHPEVGCQTQLIDADGDGHAPNTLACGDDCDDTRADVNPDQAELCDDVDHDCDGDPQPKDTPTWYLDCDADSYAALEAQRDRQCDEPAATDCGGRWTTREPVRGDSSTLDCNDGDPDARPSQASYFTEGAKESGFDFNCDSVEELHWKEAEVSPSALCSQLLACGGASGWVDRAPPACGIESDYTECLSGAGGSGVCDQRVCACQRVTIKRRQECR